MTLLLYSFASYSLLPDSAATTPLPMPGKKMAEFDEMTEFELIIEKNVFAFSDKCSLLECVENFLVIIRYISGLLSCD
jgi:hypothetical protein